MGLKKPKAVVFDWDDTIVNTWHVIRSAVNVTLESFGHEPWSEDEARSRIGPPAKVLFTELFGADQFEKADGIFIEAYKSNIVDHLHLITGAEDALKAFADSGIYMCLVSSKRGPLLRQEVEHFGFGKYFEKLLGTGDVKEDKPSALIVQEALAPVHTPDKDVWLIGDSATDLLCAANAGCTSILLETKLQSEDKLKVHPPAARFADYEKFMEFLEPCLTGAE